MPRRLPRPVLVAAAATLLHTAGWSDLAAQAHPHGAAAVEATDPAATAVPATDAARPWRPSPGAAALVALPAVTGTAPRLPQEPDTSPMAGMTGSGFFLGIIGMLGGAAVGSSLAGDCEAVCRRDRAASGAMVGGALFIPLGVHIANPEPGSMLAGSAASAVLGGVVWLLVSALPSDPMPLAPFVAAPLQLQGAIWAEEVFR